MTTTQDALAREALRKFRLIFGAVRQHFQAVEKACGVSGGISTVDNAQAGEKRKIKSHSASYGTTSHQIKVPDDEGHVLVLWENKAIYFNEITGEKTADSAHGFMDMNPVTKELSVQGYGVNVDKDGDKAVRTFVGKGVAPNQMKGTWTVKGGTGKYKGSKGGGTWTSHTLASNQSYNEVEGEMELP